MQWETPVNPGMDEFSELTDFLSEAYGKEKGWFETNSPLLFSQSEENLKKMFIIRHDNRIVCHTAIVPISITNILGRTAVIGGIAAVATSVQFRGQGLMRHMLDFCTREMTDRGYPFSVLWGLRLRYNYLGWEQAGRILGMTITSRSFRSLKINRGELLKFYGEEKVLKNIIKWHEMEKLTVNRPQSNYKKIFTGPDLQVFTNEGAYLVINIHNPVDIKECGGEPQSLIQLLFDFMNTFELSSVELNRPDDSSMLTQTLRNISDKWNISQLAKIKILDALSQRRKMPTELQKELGLAGSTVIEHLHTLEDVEIVERQETGRKFVYYELTARGENLLKFRASIKFLVLLFIAIPGALSFGLSFTSQGIQLGGVEGMRADDDISDQFIAPIIPEGGVSTKTGPPPEFPEEPVETPIEPPLEGPQEPQRPPSESGAPAAITGAASEPYNETEETEGEAEEEEGTEEQTEGESIIGTQGKTTTGESREIPPPPPFPDEDEFEGDDFGAPEFTDFTIPLIFTLFLALALFSIYGLARIWKKP